MLASEVLQKFRSYEVFGDVPIEQLEWFIEEGEVNYYQAGDYLWKTNDYPDRTFVIIKGQVRISRAEQDNIPEILIEEGQVSGFLPYSRAKSAPFPGIINEPSIIFIFPRAKIPALITTHFELTQALVSVMTTRVREFMERQKQNEKMMALGKLSAGLAHELNNPISAILRSSEALQKHLTLIPKDFKKVITIQMLPEQVDAINDIFFKKILEPRESLSPIKRAELEDEMVEWLEDNEVENLYEIAENMVDYGFDIDDLEGFRSQVQGKGFSPILNWLNDNLITEKTVKEIKEASERISTLIKSIKIYTHMDRGKDKQEVDIHDGIRNTLVIMGHKIRKENVKVIENFDISIPPVYILVGEMNQVWTNLIDNAIDALSHSEKRLLEIETKVDKGYVKVNITDSGPGIPREIKDKIFDPFFTTKEVGKGTGLGLDLVISIIKQHKGTVKVDSQPGRTTFEVCIPYKMNSQTHSN